MAVTLRLARYGAKKRPFYRVVVADRKARRDGRFIEHVGSYDPTEDPAVVELDWERVDHWLSKGAQPSRTMKTLLKTRPEATEET